MKNDKNRRIDWEKSDGLVPVIVQDADTNAVLMLGYMNQESLAKTLKTKKVWFYSRSKKRLWMKGEVSKNVLNFVDLSVDCDGDSLLVKAKPSGPTCHTGDYSCFGERESADMFTELFGVIEDRKKNAPKNSYTSFLFKGGVDAISQKVEEEALEVIKAAKKETKQRLIEETVDLMYHTFVLLVQKKISLADIGKEMQKRRK
jgi:phosphoribosyl-ATP pyrophosphohydrolase/phosphoribosyl-AMP cyclohydrolase